MSNRKLFFIFLIFFLENCKYHKDNNMNPTYLKSPKEIYRKSFKQSENFLVANELEKLKEDYCQSKWKREYFQDLGMAYTFTGQHAKAISAFDSLNECESQNFPVKNKILKKQKNKHHPFSKHAPHNAIQAISEKSKSESVIFINEAHHISMHRAFTLSLLKILYENGFRYFAAETLEKNFSKESKYPLTNHGVYISDPLYAELIRSAIKVGYEIIVYDSASGCDPEKMRSDPIACQNIREKKQAENIYNLTLKKDKFAKVLVHAGYGHIDEIGGDGWIPMAKYFKEITGINPFTVDQTFMYEHSHKKYEQEEYYSAADKYKITTPTVFKESNSGNFWVKDDLKGHFDAQVFHPRTLYLNNRPSWLISLNDRKVVDVTGDICKNFYPCLIQAYFYVESHENSVPIDQVVISQPYRVIKLVLPQGKFIVRSIDSKLNLIATDIVTVN